MDMLSTQQASTALELLANAAADRAEKFDSYDVEPVKPDSDEECDSDAPIYDSFYQSGGSAAVLQLTNFSTTEFHRVWNRISGVVLSNFNVGRGRRSSFSAKDVLFMAIVTIKQGGNWDFLGRMFGVKGPTFERTVVGFVKLFSDTVYNAFVVSTRPHVTMKKLIDGGNTFKTFKYALYATDVTFQQSNRPTGTLQESKKYYSGKHKLYGYKVEVSVLPTGLAIDCTEHYPGSVADVDILYQNIAFHKEPLKKKENEKAIVDTGDLVDDYPEEWAALMDKGYQGAAEVMRAVHPKKKPRNGFLTVDEERKNSKIASEFW